MKINQLISKAAFSRLAGVSAPSISYAVSKVFPDAMVGKKIDTQHPDVIMYLRKRGVELPEIIPTPEPTLAKVLTQKPPPAIGTARGPETREQKKRIESGESTAFNELHEDMAALLDMPMRDIVSQFGVTGGLSSWLKDVKTIEDVEKTRIANAKEVGILVSRDVIERGVMVPIEKAWNQILRDGAQTISKRVVSMVLAGDRELEVEAFVRDSLSGFIKMAKNRVRKTIRECKQQS